MIQVFKSKIHYFLILADRNKESLSHTFHIQFNILSSIDNMGYSLYYLYNFAINYFYKINHIIGLVPFIYRLYIKINKIITTLKINKIINNFISYNIGIKYVINTYIVSMIYKCAKLILLKKSLF